jgi:hypothetical protein
MAKGFTDLTKAEKAARQKEREERQSSLNLPPMTEGLGRPRKDEDYDEAIDGPEPASNDPVDKKRNARKPGGNKTRGKQALSIVGGMNQAALERIAKDFKKHPSKKTPLEVLIDIAADVNASNNARLTAANAAAPYLHKKMPSFNEDQVASTGAAPPVINIVEVKNDNAQLRADLEAELNSAIANAGKTRTE